MDEELRSFLEKVAASFDRRFNDVEQHIGTLASGLTDLRAEVNARFDGMSALVQDAVRTLRTRDIRIIAMEARLAEVEKRLLTLESGTETQS